MSLADLLAAAIANPLADAPRLAYADAVAAGDPERAEFIRAQVALARPRRLDAEQRQHLRQRAKELGKEHQARWSGELPALPGVEWADSFTRGFVEVVTVQDADTFRREADAIFAAAPVRWLCFRRFAPATLPALLAVPGLARVRGLSLTGSGAQDTGGLGNAEAALLAGCPYLASLRDLELYNNNIGDPGVRALAKSRHLGRLRSLNLIQNRVGPRGLHALGHSAALSALARLELYGNKLDDAAIIDLATSPLASRLRRLNVGGSSATVAAARAIAESPAFAALVSLDINNSEIGDAGLMYLAHSPHLGSLRALYLRQTGIGDAGVAVLARSPLAARLRVLDIQAANITGVATLEMVRSPHLADIRKLDLFDCDNLDRCPAASALKHRFGKRVYVHTARRLRPAEPNAEASTRAAFLADIRAQPDDDAPRMIYADWLDDHGDPERGEFIRVQCELYRMPPDTPGRAVLQKREDELLAAHRVEWTEGAFLAWLQHSRAECPDPYSHKACEIMAQAVEARLKRDATTNKRTRKKLEGELEQLGARLVKLRMLEHQTRLPLFEECVFERGFPELVVTTELMLLDFAGAIRDLGVVRHLSISLDAVDAEGGDQILHRVIACFDTPCLRTFSRSGAIDSLAPFEMLAAWPGAAELAHLEFGLITDVDGDDVLRILASSPYLGNLRHLELYLGEGCTEAGVRALAESPHLPSLKRVNLGEDDNDVPEAAVRLLRERWPASG